MFHLTAESCPIGELTFGGQAGKTSSTFRYIYFFNALARRCLLHRWGLCVHRGPLKKWLMNDDIFSYMSTGISEVASQNPVGSQVYFKVAWSKEHANDLTSNCFGPTTWDFVQFPGESRTKIGCPCQFLITQYVILLLWSLLLNIKKYWPISPLNTAHHQRCLLARAVQCD